MPPYSRFPDEGSPASDTGQWQTRAASPAPTIMATKENSALSPVLKRPFMSKLFGRKKSKQSLQRTSTMQPVMIGSDEQSLAPSRSATPAPLIRRTTSPFNDLSNGQYGREGRPPLPQMSHDWKPFSAPPQQTSRDGAQTSLSTYTGTSKKPKPKRSFASLANIFKSGHAQNTSSAESPNFKPEPRIKRRGTMKSTFSTSRRVRVSSRSSSFGTLQMHENGLDGMGDPSRARTSAMLSMPLPSPSMAMLFDASQAEAHATSDEPMDLSSVVYTPMPMPLALSPVNTKAQPGLSLNKSKSSPDLYSIAKNQSFPSSPTFPSPSHSRAPSRAAGGEPSPLPSRLSIALDSRFSSTKLKAPDSPMMPRSPMGLKMPMRLPGLSPKPGRSTFAGDNDRSRSPAPSAYAMSTISKKANKTYLDHILDVDLGSAPLSSERQPWSLGKEDTDEEDEGVKIDDSPPRRVAGLSVKVAKELRPNTAGTFGRPQTGNRPNTGASRPDTALTDRPDTGMSAFLGAGKHKPPPLRLDGRMRRLSTVSASEHNCDEPDLGIDGGLPSASTQDSSLSINLGKISVDTTARAQNDSGFDDLTSSQHLNISALGQGQTRRLSTGLPISFNAKKDLMRDDFRPTTADTTHLPLDLPDIDLAFDPKASLGSLGRQPSVSTLSDYENGRKVDAAIEARHSLFSNRRSSFVPPPDLAAAALDVTPRKSATNWNTNASLEPGLTMTQTTSSVSSSIMSKILSRKHLEESMFASSIQPTAPHSKHKVVGQCGEPPTPAIVMTFADADDIPVCTPLTAPFSQGSRLSSELAAAENARINDPFDPYGNSYFPPVRTIAPHSPFPSSGTTSGPPSACGPGPGNDTDVVKRLLEQLEAETSRREALEYSLASMRESTGADLRRSDQKIKELTAENKRLLARLARRGSLGSQQL